MGLMHQAEPNHMALIAWQNGTICIEFPICFMSTSILHQILVHPFLLPPAPKCMVKHQFFKDQSTKVTQLSHIESGILKYWWFIQLEIGDLGYGVG